MEGGADAPAEGAEAGGGGEEAGGRVGAWAEDLGGGLGGRRGKGEWRTCSDGICTCVSSTMAHGLP